MITSLEPHESNAHFPPAAVPDYKILRHRRDAERRPLLRQTLASIQTSPRVLERWDGCGSEAFIYQHLSCPHLTQLRSNKCRHRLCPACQRDRGAVIRHNLEYLGTKAGRRLKLLTFTLAHTSRELRPQIDRLTAAFRDLRRLKFWKEAVRAAAWVLEVKIGRDGKWHPHLHVLLDAAFIPQHLISAAWLSCTGDSFIVHIKPISASHGAAYISKYVTKAIDQSVLDDPSSLQQYALAIKGKRTCATLGTWRKCPLAEKIEDDTLLIDDVDTSPGNWRCLGTWSEMAQRALAGESFAIETLALCGFTVENLQCPTPLSSG